MAGSLNETAEACTGLGAKVHIIQADLADEQSRLRIIPAALEEFGTVNILVNNAVAAIYKPLDQYSLKHRRIMTEINVQAPLDLIQQSLPSMFEANEGWIVNLSSGSKRHPSGPPYDLGGVKGVYGFYGATKAMLDRLTTALASELADKRIRVNTVEPKPLCFLREPTQLLETCLLRLKLNQWKQWLNPSFSLRTVNQNIPGGMK